MLNALRHLGSRFRRRSSLPDRIPAADTAITWLTPRGQDGAAMMDCPNCGAIGAKSPQLEVRFSTGTGPERSNRLLRCPDCTSQFYEDRRIPDYADDVAVGAGRVPFYLQQGAGIGLLANVLAEVDAPPGSAYLEIGCGFGFALDFAQQEMGWLGVGIDPGAMAALGATRLGLRIERRYLDADEAARRPAADVVMAAETIEHVASPLAFLRVIRSVLRPGGVVALTTPDADCLRQDTAPGAMIALLSPGHHLVFQSEASLRALLREAGFPEVIVRHDGYGLVAHASDRPLRLADAPQARRRYLAYLERRGSDFPPGDDLQLGLHGRLLHEAMNDGDTARAGAAFALLRQACRTRFDLDLDRLVNLPDAAIDASLEQLSQIMPLGLASMLHADALRRLALGTPRPALEQRFLCAAAAADGLRQALQKIGTDDALSEALAWSAQAEAVLCAAETAAIDVVDRLLALPPPPHGGEDRRHGILRRGFVALVNAEAYACARSLCTAAGLDAWAESGEIHDKADLDTLFCLAVLAVRGDEAAAWPVAASRFQLVCDQLAGPDSPLFWPAARGQVMALERLADAAGLAALLAQLTDRGIVLPADLATRAAALDASRQH